MFLICQIGQTHLLNKCKLLVNDVVAWIPTDEEFSFVNTNCKSEPLIDFENGVSVSVSDILILTIVTPLTVICIKVWRMFSKCCSWCQVSKYVYSYRTTTSVSILSSNVIFVDIVSPLSVVEPLKFNSNVKLPLLSTAIAGLDEVNDCTDGEPCDGE